MSYKRMAYGHRTWKSRAAPPSSLLLPCRPRGSNSYASSLESVPAGIGAASRRSPKAPCVGIWPETAIRAALCSAVPKARSVCCLVAEMHPSGFLQEEMNRKAGGSKDGNSRENRVKALPCCRIATRVADLQQRIRIARAAEWGLGYRTHCISPARLPN